MPEFASAQFAQVFAHPVMTYCWPGAEALNRQLLPLVLAQEARSGGEARSNVGGWHSETGRLEFLGEPGRRLVANMHAMADEATARALEQQATPGMNWALSAWVNVNRDGDFNRVHTHPGATWSGTYYVDAGAPPANSPVGTPLHLTDPCQGRANTFLSGLASTNYLIRPEAGMMVLFPGYMPHMVFAHRGARPRVSIAFNLRREPFP